jgi:CheY-like chemotaxis protein
MDGYEAIQKKFKSGKTIPIIALTADVVSGDIKNV